MARTYWRVAPAFWSDEKVTGANDGEPWTDDAKLLALYLLTCQHRTVEGLFRLPKGYIMEDLGWTEQRLAKPFGQLLRDGFIEYDSRARLCLIVNALEYQAPENPNQITAALKILDDLPRSALFARLLQQAERLCQPLAERLREGLPERFGKPPAPALTLTPDIPVGVAETATDDHDEFAGIDFGEPPPDTEKPPQNGSRPKNDMPEQPQPENAGTMVGYLVDYAGEIGYTLTGSKKGHFAKAIGDIWQAGVDAEILRRAIRQALDENKSPAHLVDVLNDLKGGGRGKTRRDSGRSQHGEWE